ncbi:MAG: PilT/PilU family type 4a pilus ATPase [Candidatus Omnitrophica bacterium]|nr:PilT/PilU family type 4a pilus ATPase [Candidatus Omnitrophota bacterium]
MDIKNILSLVMKQDASDLFLKTGCPPYFRIKGEVTNLNLPAVSREDMDLVIKSILTPVQIEAFNRDKELDFITDFSDIGRFRGNLSLDRQNISLVFRNVKRKIQTFYELGLPVKIFEKLSMQSRGLILLTGAIGSGKSTTIASMIDYMNWHKNKHILTVEEPVEFVFENRNSIVTQREIGFDTSSYTEALRHSVYQSPDVIFIGTIRDSLTMATAINAAETGQLVLSTIHSINAPQAVERIINFFPEHQHTETRMQLSLLLKGIISLRPNTLKAVLFSACRVFIRR